MANRKRKKPQKKKTPKQPPSQKKATAQDQPTQKASKGSLADQLKRLVGVDTGVDELAADLGPPDQREDGEASGSSLDEILRKAEGSLSNTRSLLEKAKEREAAARKAEDALAVQKRDQQESFRQRKRAADAEHKARIDEVDATKAELKQRAKGIEERQRAVEKGEKAQKKKEGELADLAAKLTEREINAEEGFLAEKTRILQPIEEDVERLRQERDELDASVRDRQKKAETEERTRAEKRAKKDAKEDQKRAEAEAKQRRQFDEKMANLRREELERLRGVLQQERADVEASWETELGNRQQHLDTRESDLDEREQALDGIERGLRQRERDLETNQEILDEDKEALASKVERLVNESTEDLRHDVDSLQKQLADARTQRDAYFADLESRHELDRRFGDRSPKQILDDLRQSEKERDEALAQLRQLPDSGAAERLSALEAERSAWLDKRASLEAELAQAQGELATRRLAAIELEALKKQKEALEIHKRLLDGAVDELRDRVEELTRQDDRRNPMTALTSLDEQEELLAEPRTTTPLGRATPTLREFVEDLRHRIATGIKGRTLYYTERDIRAFLGGLAMTRLLLLQGISGTGKTSLPLAFASAVKAGCLRVEVQAGWRDRQDLVGYYNAFHRHYYATNFLQALYTAGTPAYRDRLFIIVLDEINLSRPEQFFADFLSALEAPPEDRRLTLVSDPVSNAPKLMIDGRHIPIPPNVWFVGTANHDETKFEFADFTYDRAHVMEMQRVTEKVHFGVEPRGNRNPISYEKLDGAFRDAVVAQEKAVRKATNWLRTSPIVGTMDKRFRVGWGNRLENQLASYLPVVVEAGGTIGEAVDHLLVTKVLRKLKDRHDIRATALEELEEQFITSWDKLDKKNPPEHCVALIEHEIAEKKGEDLI